MEKIHGLSYNHDKSCDDLDSSEVKELEIVEDVIIWLRTNVSDFTQARRTSHPFKV